MKNPELSATQSIFETIKTSVEMDGYATIPLVRIQRQMGTGSINELFERFLNTPVEFSAYDKMYVAVVLDEKIKPLSPGRVKQLERTKGEIRYRQNSRVIESRRPNNNWRTNENATVASLETATVTILPRERWIEIENERRLQGAIAEKTERDERLAKRYIGKSRRARYAEERADKKPFVNDWVTLAKNIEDIAKIPNDAIITVGFGADTTTPLRILSYPLLALSILREKPGTRLEYYCATQFSELFGLSAENAKQTESILSQLLQSFIYKFYPDLSERVQFIPSQPLTNEQNTFIRESLVPILKNKQVFRDFANQRNGTDSLAYIAAHSLYMRDPLPINPSLFINPLPKSNLPIVMVGGDAERMMWDARQLIINTFGGTLPIQLFTTLGRTPPYFTREAEPVIGGALTQDYLLGCSPEVYRDYASLLVAIAKSYGDSNIRYDDVSFSLSQRSNFLSQDSIGIAILLLNEFSTQTKGAI